MKVLQINSFGNLSTGRIAVDIYRTLHDKNHDGMVAFGRNIIAKDVPHIKIGNIWSVYADAIMTRFTDRAGLCSRRATKKLIKQIEEYNPDIIHLHPVLSGEHLLQLEKIQEVLPSRRDEAHFR